jgi:tetratricopeptide (TPR) repeat protein
VLFQRLMQIIHRIGSALQFAHQHGLVHGAVTFGNILLDQNGEAALADFGLARLQPLAPPYLAPELQNLYQQAIQTRNLGYLWQALNPSTDIYALAILCHQLFTRTLPPGLQEHVYPVLQCATSQNPGRRFPTVEQFIQELTHRLTNQRFSMSGVQKASQPSWPGPPITRPNVHISGTGSGVHTSGIRAQQPTPIPNQNEDWEKRGDRFFTERDYYNAIKAYKRALEGTPNKASLWLALGDTFFALDQLADALQAYEQAIQQNPNDPLAWMNRGTALDALGRHGEALDCFERAEQLR